MKMLRPTLCIAAAQLSLSLFGLAATHDGEWPPAADPQWTIGGVVIGNPSIGTPLYLDRVEFAIPNNAPDFIANWLTHFHTAGSCPDGFGGWKTDFAIGDVDNDGLADDIVITMAGEAVFAAEMVIDYGAHTGQLNPLWFWRTPWAIAKLGATPNHGPFSCHTLDRNNPLIWNVVADGTSDDTNEVVFVGLADDGSTNGKQQLFVLRTNTSGGVDVVATSPVSAPDLSNQIHRGPGICRVRNTEFPRDIVLTQHGEGQVFIWSHEAGSTLTLKYSANPCTDAQILAGTHDYNWLDIDGDGFDEFFLNGLVDFVNADASGNPVATNGQIGIARWQLMDDQSANCNGGHCDNIFVADWDPKRPGLELYAVTEEGSDSFWYQQATPTDIPHAKPYDTLWDADTGELLYEWTNAPAQDGQNIFGGNWTTTYDGLEAILSPKDLAGQGQVIAPGQTLMTGSYATAVRSTPNLVDEEFKLLTIDGAIYDDGIPGVTDVSPYEPPANALRVRSGGPWRRMFSMDWNGDYATDEILHHPFDAGNLLVFRLGEKGDWGAGPLPLGLPTQAQVQSSTAPIQGEGDDGGCAGTGWWYFYSQGECGDQPTWNWSNGGPGRGTHYFQKLKEVFPNTGQQGGVVVRAYDLGGLDHREEIVVISPTPTPLVHVYFNSDPLPSTAFARPSPQGSLAYRAYRQWRTDAVQPFSFQEQAVAIKRFGIRPTNASLPERVIGIPHGGNVQFEAFIEFEDGSETDVSSLVTWHRDVDVVPHFSIVGGLVTHTSNPAVTVSGRFHARMTIEGKLWRSEPSYVFAANSIKPEILRAGFLDSWIVDDSSIDDRPLRFEAWVGQRDNAPPVVYALKLNGSKWSNIVLLDNGLGADEHAGDGIYTTTVTTQPGLALGDNLRALRAIQPPFENFMAIGYPPIGAAHSGPWPYLVINASENPTWPNPASPPLPWPTNDSERYEAPRIRALGHRGWGVADEMVIEVEIIPSPLHPNATVSVYADIQIPGLTTPVTNPVMLTSQGGNIYSKKISTAGATPGLYVVHIGAVAVDPASFGSGVFVSDFYPKIRLHDAPSWDVDEPPDLPGWDWEPARW